MQRTKELINGNFHKQKYQQSHNELIVLLGRRSVPWKGSGQFNYTIPYNANAVEVGEAGGGGGAGG